MGVCVCVLSVFLQSARRLGNIYNLPHPGATNTPQQQQQQRRATLMTFNAPRTRCWNTFGGNCW